MKCEYFNSSLGFGDYKQIAVDLLKITIDILDEFNIDYFLISGTLLGYIRHNDFIPYDDDMDLIVNSDIKKHLPNIFKKYNYKLSMISKNNLVKLCFTDKVFNLNHFKIWSSCLLNSNDSYCSNTRIIKNVLIFSAKIGIQTNFFQIKKKNLIIY